MGERTGGKREGAKDRLPLPGRFGQPPKVSLHKLLVQSYSALGQIPSLRGVFHITLKVSSISLLASFQAALQAVHSTPAPCLRAPSPGSWPGLQGQSTVLEPHVHFLGFSSIFAVHCHYLICAVK